MMKMIVIALKPGVNSAPLIELAESVAQPDAHFHFLSLITIGTDSDERERLTAVEAQLKATCEKLAAKCRSSSFTARISSMGLAGHILEIATDVAANLLVIGFAKRTRVGKALLGSDAQAVLLQAEFPVLASRIS